MRKLYWLELNSEELTALVEALQEMGRWKDNDFRCVLVGELLAQHNRDEVGQTEILFDYQNTIQTNQQVDKHTGKKVFPFEHLLRKIASRLSPREVKDDH